MNPIWWIFIYAVLASLVVFLSIKLSNYVDLLDKKTKVSGALLGGILLAGVTSLPELFTSLTGTLIVKDNSLVLGNIMGSDFFDIMIFGVVYFLFFKKFTEGKVGKQHYLTCLFTALMLVTVTIAAFVFNKNGWLIGWFNPMSLVVIAIYVVSIILTPKTEEKEEQEEVETKLTVKQIWILLAVFSVILIGASISVTLVTDQIVENFHIDGTFGGTLFLGVATSLREGTATLSHCKKKNFNAAYGDILGSCVFNIIILGIADALSFHAGPLYNVTSESLMLMIGTAFTLLVVFLSIIFIRSKSFKNDAKSRVFLYIFGTLLISSYIAYLAISTAGIQLI